MNGFGTTLARRRFRLTALIVAIIGVLALAAAAFVLSYPGVRDTALTAGVSMKLARIYPGIFDAVLLVAGVGALSLRGALRGYAWLALLVVASAVAAADAVHAMSVVLPKRPIEAAVAIVPWAVLLVGFTLLYAMARQGWPSRRAVQAAHLAVVPPESHDDVPAAAANGVPASAPTGQDATTKVPLSALLTDKPGATKDPKEPKDPKESKDAVTTPQVPAAETTTASETTAASETAAPATAAIPAAPAAVTTPVAVTMPEPLVAQRQGGRDDPSDADAEPVEPGVHFNRLRSSPTPPEENP